MREKRESTKSYSGHFEDWKKSNKIFDFDLVQDPCPRCYTPFRRSCETISLSKFNANTVQIRQAYCWGPIKGHKAVMAQLLLIREGRQTGLSLPVLFRSISQVRTLCRSIHTRYLPLPGGDVYATQNLLSTRFACAYRLSPDDTPDGS